MTHSLKIWSQFYDAIVRGDKTYELRKNDRGYKKDDVLHLREWRHKDQQYTGREMNVRVSWITYGPSFGIITGYCCMAIKEVE